MEHRAYSLLEIKAVDDDARVITGIATTPETDRMGDVVEPEGAEFKLPIPLLWQHDSHQPIGEVFAAKVTSAGIEIKARIAKLDEPGALKDRLDSAWLSIKNKLVRGLSIGFQPIEHAHIDGSFGIRFVKWLWLELSAVTIPANAGASIQSLKSFDAPFLAATGTQAAHRARPTSPGDTGIAVVKVQKGTSPMAKNIQDQIKDFQATRAAKAARMAEIMSASAETGETLDAEQSEEYDTLEGEIGAVDKHLVRLETLEKAQVVPTLRTVDGTTEEKAAASRAGSQHQVIQVAPRLEKGIEFARYAMCLMRAKGNVPQALDIARSRYADNPRIHTVLKAAVSAGTTTDADWAGNLVDYQNFMGDFIEYLRPSTILGKFGTTQNGVSIPSLKNVPFNIRITGQTSGGTGYWVGQGKPKPLTKFDFSAVTLGFAKVAGISVLADELVRFSSPSAEAIVRDALRDCLVERLDTDLIDPNKAASSGVSPASITNGLTPISSTGNDADAIRRDIQALMAPFIAANVSPSNGVFIMSETTALALSLMTNALGQPEFSGLTMLGGRFLGFPVITSQYAAVGSPLQNMVIFLNASDIFLADDGQVVIDASREASLEMSDAPTQSQPTGASLVSLWQNNLLGLRAERYINWQKRRASAVAYIADASWGETATSPA